MKKTQKGFKRFWKKKRFQKFQKGHESAQKVSKGSKSL